jgi:hypothetical protein
VHEQQATDELIEFIRHRADLDDLARLYTLLFTGETVAVKGYHGVSEYFTDGELTHERRTRQ